MKLYFRLNEDFPAESPWWRSGGSQLWGRLMRAGWFSEDCTGYYVYDEIARKFLQEAVNIKGWWDGPSDQPHPLKVKVMEER